VYWIPIKWKMIPRGPCLIGAVIIICAIGAASAKLPPSQADFRQPKVEFTAIAFPPHLTIPRYHPGHQPFRGGETLLYNAWWIGIPAAEARVTLLKNGANGTLWTGKLWLRSSSAVDLLYRMRDYVYEDFDRRDLRPREMRIVQHENKRRDEWSIRFDDSAHLVTSAKRNAQGRTWIRQFSGGEPWGPFSGAMLALSLPLEVGKTYTFDVFSGGNRYVLAFYVDRRESITTSLGTLPALRIIPSVVWLSEGRFRSQVSQSVLWLSDDERHLPLRIEATAYIGTIHVDLTKILNGPNAVVGETRRLEAAESEHPSQLLTPTFTIVP
jgi:hypothetical protein